MVSSGRFVASLSSVYNNGELIYSSIILKINFFSNSTDWVSQVHKREGFDNWGLNQALSQLSADTSTIYMFHSVGQLYNRYSPVMFTFLQFLVQQENVF